MKVLIKELQTVFRNEFARVVRDFGHSKLTDDDLQTYIDNFPAYYVVLDSVHKECVEEERKSKYKQTINAESPLVQQFRARAGEELTLLKEELQMTERGFALEPTKAITKYNKERRLNKRIEDTQKTIDTLDKLIIELAPPKRKVGRPKKNKDDNI